MSKEIVCVIPTYNEEKIIEEVVKCAIKYCDSILVVCARRCTDKTTDIVKKLSKRLRNVKYIIDRGKGKGDALRCAIEKLEGDKIVVFMDADGSHDPKDIPKLVKPILEGKADFVIGSRMLGGSEELYGSLGEFARLFASCIITLIINYRFGARFTDYQNGFRAIKLKELKKLKLESDITTIEQEMAIKALKKGLKILEVPTHEYRRKYGKSSFSLLKVWHKYLFNLLNNII